LFCLLTILFIYVDTLIHFFLDVPFFVCGPALLGSVLSVVTSAFDVTVPFPPLSSHSLPRLST
jgi:hypothetical protein